MPYVRGLLTDVAQRPPTKATRATQVFVLDLGDELARELHSAYFTLGDPELVLAEARAGTVVVAVVSLAGALLALRAPFHEGNRGLLIPIEKRLLEPRHLLNERVTALITVAAGAVVMRVVPRRAATNRVTS